MDVFATIDMLAQIGWEFSKTGNTAKYGKLTGREKNQLPAKGGKGLSGSRNSWPVQLFRISRGLKTQSKKHSQIKHNSQIFAI